MQKGMILVVSLCIIMLGVTGCSKSEGAVSDSGKQESGTTTETTSEDVLWPNTKTVELIVPAGAGTNTDAAARSLVTYWKKRFPDHNFIVTNDTSGNYTVAYEKVRTAKPDGSTLLWGTSSTVLTYYFGVYDHQISEFTNIQTLNWFSDGVTLTVRADSPFETLPDLIDYAKEHPDKLTIGTGSGNIVYALALEMEDLFGCRWRKVDGKDGNERTAAVLGGYNDLMMIHAPQMQQYVADGKVRILAIYQNERSEYYPELIPVSEYGYTVPDRQNIYPLCGPLGMDEDMVEFIASTYEGFAQDEEAQKMFNTMLKVRYEYLPRKEANKTIDLYKEMGKRAANAAN